MTARKKFEAFAPYGALTHFHKNLNARANLFKITNDIQFLGSHPRSVFKRTESLSFYMAHEKPLET
ncbi:hypothetical protein [Bartonella sp. CL266QHHD]|uniref:hypothetical protein n=1 Tax=Bartonella sp. CL266QHHD TaxID=3243519 RepID=UPI0035CF1667